MQSLSLFLIRFGTLPFIILSAGIIFKPELMHNRGEIIFISYASLILSFIAGMNWGLFHAQPSVSQILGSTKSKCLLIWSTTAMLLAWFTLFFHKHPAAFICIALLYLIEVFIEKYLAQPIYPSWLLKSRTIPMLISILTLLAIAFF